MDPSSWGPYAWKTLHSIAAHSDAQNEISSFKLYAHSLADSLPCNTCRQHMKEYLKSHPIPDKNCFEWTVTFHNNVNKRLGKPELNIEEAKLNYNKNICTSACNEENDTQGALVLYLIIFLSGVLIFMFIKNATK